MNKNDKYIQTKQNKTKQNNKSNGPNSPKEFYFSIRSFPRAINALIDLSVLTGELRMRNTSYSG